MTSLLYQLALSATFLGTCSAVSIEITTIVEAGRRTCFYEELTAGRTLDVSFSVMRGGNLDILFYARGPQGGTLSHLDNRKRANLEIKIEETGVHELCLDNSVTRFAEKVVVLDFFDDKPMDDHDTAYDELQEPEPADFEEMEMTVKDMFEVIDKLRKGVTMTRRYMYEIRSNERIDWTLLSGNNKRVVQLSIISIVLMIASTAAQVLFIRSMFTSKRSANNMKITNVFS